MDITINDLLKNLDKEKDKPIVFCGHCGAIEVYVSEKKRSALIAILPDWKRAITKDTYEISN